MIKVEIEAFSQTLPILIHLDNVYVGRIEEATWLADEQAWRTPYRFEPSSTDMSYSHDMLCAIVRVLEVFNLRHSMKMPVEEGRKTL